MELQTSDLLSTLISAGADASTNLFTVNITSHSQLENNSQPGNSTNISSATYRITNIALPTHAMPTVDLPYQGSRFLKIGPGSSNEKTLTIPIRLDDAYLLLRDLKKQLPLSLDGFLEVTSTAESDYDNLIKEGFSNISRSSVVFDITVQALRYGTKHGLVPAYTWLFRDCELQEIPTISYSYDSSNPVTTNLKFIYKYCEENKVPEPPQIKKLTVTGQAEGAT